MPNPSLARTDDRGLRYYPWRDESFWSVTVIINGGVPKYLGPHYAKLAAELAYAALIDRGPHSRSSAIARRLAAAGRADFLERQARGELKTVKLEKQSERDLALRWIKGAADRHRDAAAQRGSAVHAEAEQVVLEYAREAARLSLVGVELAPWPEAIESYRPGFVSWVNDFRPEFLAAEATVFNRSQAYAGTLDTIIRVRAGDLVAAIRANGDNPAASIEAAAIWAGLTSLPADTPLVVVVDFKTGRAVYAEVALQLSAYARHEFIGHPDGRTELPAIASDLGAVLHLRADGTYRFHLVRIDDAIYDAFRFAREVFRFNDETARSVFLQDLTPRPPEPTEEVA
jgi:hypothetical protein